MKRMFRWCVRGLVLVALCVGLWGPQRAEAVKGATAAIGEMLALVEELRREVEALKTDLVALQTSGSTQSEDIAALQASDATQSTQISFLETDVLALDRNKQGVIACLSQKGNEVFFRGCNVNVQSGSGTTDGSLNGLGNLIVGYNENVAMPPSPKAKRTGSHNFVIGQNHEYTSYGGLVAGLRSTVSGANASVSGGLRNKASEFGASVSGGVNNSASAPRSSVSGGKNRAASELDSWVAGTLPNP